jgi:hypothetical protein
MLRKQLAVAVGMGAAVIVLLYLWQHLAKLPLPRPDGNDQAARLAFVAHWLLLPAMALLAGILAIANQRFFIAGAIDGGRSPGGWFLEVTLRYNQNTLEQIVLAAIAWSGLALVLPHEQLGLIPGLAILFFAGRIIFWIGYLIAPAGRAFGLGLTAYPTFAALFWLAWHLVS